MKITIPIAASAVVLALALTGCSSAALPGGASTGGSGGSGGAPAGNSTQSYTAAELVTILQKTEATLNVKGTISDNAKLKADLAGGGLGKETFVQLMAKEGATIVPASCGTALNALTADANQYGEGGSGIGSELSYTNYLIGISATTNGSTAPAQLVAKMGNQLNTMAQNCSSFKIDLKTGSTSTDMTMAIKKLNASTDANQTYAFEEDITIPGETKLTRTASIVGIVNNLYISVTGFSSANLPNLVKAVNAVVGAAKG